MLKAFQRGSISYWNLLGGEESIGIDAEGQVADRLERSVIACAVAGVDVRTLDAGEPDLVTCTLAFLIVLLRRVSLSGVSSDLDVGFIVAVALGVLALFGRVGPVSIAQRSLQTQRTGAVPLRFPSDLRQSVRLAVAVLQISIAHRRFIIAGEGLPQLFGNDGRERLSAAGIDAVARACVALQALEIAVLRAVESE